MVATKKKPVKSKKIVKGSVLAGDALVIPFFSRYFLMIAVVVSMLLLLWVISPFFTVLIYAALIAIFFNPMNEQIVKLFKGHRGVASFFSTVIVLLLVLGPLTLFVLFLTQEAVVAYQVLEKKILLLDFQAIDINKFETIPYIGIPVTSLIEKYHVDSLIAQSNVDLYLVVKELGQSISTFIVNSGASIVKSLGNTIVNVLLLILTVFFFFRDGGKFRDYLKALSPLPKEHENDIEKKMKEITYGIAFGTFGTAILQGIMGGIGFAIAGLSHATFYATIMAFAALIPYFGSSIIWGPAAVALLFQGEIGWGIFLMVWGLLVIANIDNLTRPYLIGTSLKMHSLATFLAVLGGLFVFGINGIVFGPLILSLVLTIFHIYRLEYNELLA